MSTDMAPGRPRAVTYGETNLVSTIEQVTGAALADLDPSQLGGIDQFHAGGAEAVQRLLPSLAVTAGMTALDVGSGLGGPARQIARATGCAVVGVDTAPSYVHTARALTDAAGPAGLVSFTCADIAAVRRSDFDAAFTIHVQMNVADKQSFYRAIAARLRPGGRLAVFEVCRSGTADPTTPLPWSLDGTDSFLATPPELQADIGASGFDTREWVDETGWALQWFRAVATSSAAGGPPVRLPALLTDGTARMTNFAAGLRDGTLTVHRGAFVVRK